MYRPLIYSDLPDPDIIRVGDTYYMISTTMHMFPGGDLYRSRDLIRWELCCHLYDKLDETPSQQLKEGHIYGQGMWAACLRHHEGLFHVFFVCNDTHKTYHFTAPQPEGPWQWHHVEGFYHDCSVLFEDGHAYIVYGNREIRLTELNDTLTGPKEGGIDTVILRDLPPEKMMLGFEGTHFYKINGRYCLFFIHWPQGGMRTEACYVSDTLTGPYTGGDVLQDDMGFFGQGVAQGGVVQDPEGKWHALLFQDHGAVGRVPVLCDVVWKDGFPVFSIADLPPRTDADVRALYAAEEDFTAPLSSMWQFNHQPSDHACETSPEGLTVQLMPAADMEHARNTLTQRAFGPRCRVSVQADASLLQEGGRMGLGVLQGCFAGLFIEKKNGRYQLGLEARVAEKQQLKSDEPVSVSVLMPLFSPKARLNMDMDFTDMKDTVTFSVTLAGRTLPVGLPHRLHYRLDHFMGARIALYGYDTEETGSRAHFTGYTCQLIENS